jgi:hypothetical protein
LSRPPFGAPGARCDGRASADLGRSSARRDLPCQPRIPGPRSTDRSATGWPDHVGGQCLTRLLPPEHVPSTPGLRQRHRPSHRGGPTGPNTRFVVTTRSGAPLAVYDWCVGEASQSSRSATTSSAAALLSPQYSSNERELTNESRAERYRSVPPRLQPMVKEVGGPRRGSGTPCFLPHLATSSAGITAGASG